MLKASSLYMVIVIALVIGILCSALVASSLFYKLQHMRSFRYERLANNLSSGINIMLAGSELPYNDEQVVDLYHDEQDSIALTKLFWGMYDVGIVKAFINTDTLLSVFSIAHRVDSAKWAALYLIDEDRPLNLSGVTEIKGNAFIPKAGVKKGYVNNRFYTGDSRLIIGEKYYSERNLPELNKTRLDKIYHYLTSDSLSSNFEFTADSVGNSYLNRTSVHQFYKNTDTLSNITLNGNIILRSDTTLFISKSARLNNVMIFARAIVVQSGFSGTCQLYARDSVSIGKNCTFNYPSAIGVMTMEEDQISLPPRCIIGEKTVINGTIFTFQQKDSNLMPLIGLKKDVTIKGQVYADGILQFEGHYEIDGSLFTKRFLHTSGYSTIENTIIDATINSKALSKYYLTSDLIPVSSNKRQVLQWLEKR